MNSESDQNKQLMFAELLQHDKGGLYLDEDIINKLTLNHDYSIFQDESTITKGGCLPIYNSEYINVAGEGAQQAQEKTSYGIKRLKEYLKGRFEGLQKGKTIIPININENHWVALVIEKNDENVTVKYVDPKGNEPSLDIAQAIKEVFGENVKFENIFTEENAPQAEDNDHDCGPLLVDTLNRIIEGVEPDPFNGVSMSVQDKNAHGQDVRRSQAEGNSICKITLKSDGISHLSQQQPQQTSEASGSDQKQSSGLLPKKLSQVSDDCSHEGPCLMFFPAEKIEYFRTDTKPNKISSRAFPDTGDLVKVNIDGEDYYIWHEQGRGDSKWVILVSSDKKSFMVIGTARHVETTKDLKHYEIMENARIDFTSMNMPVPDGFEQLNFVGVKFYLDDMREFEKSVQGRINDHSARHRLPGYVCPAFVNPQHESEEQKKQRVQVDIKLKIAALENKIKELLVNIQREISKKNTEVVVDMVAHAKRDAVQTLKDKIKLMSEQGAELQLLQKLKNLSTQMQIMVKMKNITDLYKLDLDPISNDIDVCNITLPQLVKMISQLKIITPGQRILPLEQLVTMQQGLDILLRATNTQHSPTVPSMNASLLQVGVMQELIQQTIKQQLSDVQNKLKDTQQSKCIPWLKVVQQQLEYLRPMVAQQWDVVVKQFEAVQQQFLVTQKSVAQQQFVDVQKQYGDLQKRFEILQQFKVIEQHSKEVRSIAVHLIDMQQKINDVLLMVDDAEIERKLEEILEKLEVIRLPLKVMQDQIKVAKDAKEGIVHLHPKK